MTAGAISSIVSSFLWAVTGSMIHIVAKTKFSQAPPRATAYRILSTKEEQERSVDETTVVRTDDPDGTITVVTTTVIKPGGVEGAAVSFDNGPAKV